MVVCSFVSLCVQFVCCGDVIVLGLFVSLRDCVVIVCVVGWLIVGWLVGCSFVWLLCVASDVDCVLVVGWFVDCVFDRCVGSWCCLFICLAACLLHCLMVVCVCVVACRLVVRLFVRVFGRCARLWCSLAIGLSCD